MSRRLRDAALAVVLPGMVAAWLVVRHGTGAPGLRIGLAVLALLPLGLLPLLGRAVRLRAGQAALLRDLGARPGQVWRMLWVPALGPALAAGAGAAALWLGLAVLMPPLGLPLGAMLLQHRPAAPL